MGHASFGASGEALGLPNREAKRREMETDEWKQAHPFQAARAAIAGTQAAEAADDPLERMLHDFVATVDAETASMTPEHIEQRLKELKAQHPDAFQATTEPEN